MTDKQNITGIILSGGKSSRMGTDKGFLSFNGTLFMQHSINALNPLVSEIIIVSNNTDYDVFGLNRIEDAIENAGPLAGIYSGLKQSKTDYNLVLSCDVPLINSTVLQKLIDCIDDDSDIIQIESQGKAMPLIAVYKKQCAPLFLKLLNAGERRLQYAVNHCNVKNVVLHDEETYFTQNINTPEQLNAILKMIITIKYFGLIAEITRQTEETIDFSGNTIANILELLYSKYPDLKNKDFKVAQNQELVSESTEITGQELALLPPFSGG